MAEPTHIVVRNARANNLKGVDLEVPRNKLVVFTGVSGSGKSSLVYDTLYQEGQRRFLDSLSSYARQFLGQIERPEVDLVTGISPTISIDQKTVNRNPRSTVGTITEIYDHLRLLMARLGTPHCPECDKPVAKLGVDQVVDHVLALGNGAKVIVLGPVIRERKGQYIKEMADLHRDGWIRARVDGEMVRLDELPTLERYKKHTIEVVVDRLVARPSERSRLAEALETALRLGDQTCTVMIGEASHVFATRRACADHPGIAIPELEPRLFSFNTPQGACPDCDGLGAHEDFDPDRLYDPAKPVLDAYLPFNAEGRLPFMRFDRDDLRSVVKQLKGSLRTPVGEWPEAQRHRLLYGDPDLIWTSHVVRDDGRKEVRQRQWRGLVGMLRWVWRFVPGYSGFQKFRVRSDCGTCHGARLNPIALAVRFRERSIHDLIHMSVQDAGAFFRLRLRTREKEIGELLLSEIRERLDFLLDVGLGYLNLDRSADTLSGGESQRIRLARQVGSGLQGVTYILDEPSIGLHPRDNRRLIAALRRLRDRGNSVLVVEHDAETMLASDYIVDVGPGAGRHGGHVVGEGTPKRFAASDSPTAVWLRGERNIPVPMVRRAPKGRLSVRGARCHNLTGVDIDVPLGTMTVVTGVSGSGKSTFVFQVLEPNVRNQLAGNKVAQHCESVRGVAKVDKLIRISQQPIGRTPRSNPATYTKAFDVIRDLFARTAESRARGYKKGRFSFNVSGGRCEACEGAGVKTVEMQFLPSVNVTCDICGGRRFNRETLDITYRGMSIHQVLKLTIDEALEVFSPVPKLKRIFSTLVDVGLGYVALGQPSTTLSGGEAQRMKLATELHRPATGKTLYLLDEPTTGLHFEDVERLLVALNRLVDAGNTVVVVEHHTDVIKCADWLIDLGPDGGDGGGQVVGVGTPEHLSTLQTPTGRAMAALGELQTALLAAEPLPAVPPPAPTRHRVTTADRIAIRGARQHNLQAVDVDIPHGQLTVITGPSGSGKSSLAFDTIFSEGQRRYVESLSTYARRFLGRMDRAPVERAEGLQPAIAIDQARASRNPRSTVATVTEIHDVLRLLWARIGQAHCPTCGKEVGAQSPSQAAAALRGSGLGAGWMVTDLVPTENPVERRKSLIRDGWVRLLDGHQQVDLAGPAAETLLAGGGRLVLDRVNATRVGASRAAEAIGSAYGLGGGRALFVPKSGDPMVFTERPACPDHGELQVAEFTPRHFSFNSRVGACSVCEGVGARRRVVAERVFVDLEKPVFDALDPKVASGLGRSQRNLALLQALLDDHGVPRSAPVSAWSAAASQEVLFGREAPITIQWTKSWGRTSRHITEDRQWEGLVAIIRGWSGRWEHLTAMAPCEVCQGSRLRPESGLVTVQGEVLGHFLRRPVDSALERVRGWQLVGERALIAERAVQELERRLAFLAEVGLGYLGLERSAETLSGGEAQRIRLASQLGSGLTGVTYVLDEPTIGLHPRDTDRLLGSLEGLRDLGNTLVVVEHDPDTMWRADYLIDLGPGAGQEGGRVLSAGTPAEVAADPNSGTGRWLSGQERMTLPVSRRKPSGMVTLTKPTANNLKLGEVEVPLGVWTSVSGVSGSGKSSLVVGTLAPALRRHAQPRVEIDVAPHGGIRVRGSLDRVVLIDQSPIGRSPRSTPATYCGVLDKLRTLFASIPGARERGWKPGRFSFNAHGGRCPICEGRGAILVEMHFLPDVWVQCDACRGRRYNRETLEVRWKGHSIADVLSLRIEEAAGLFLNQRALASRFEALINVGLGYMSLGQPANTLSGGEAQRVKLASELVSRKGHTVYVLDEPTTGLHLSDIRRLVAVLHQLVENGNTVVTIEHHLDVLAQSDWLIELGPDGGEAGGRLVGVGKPEDVAGLSTPTGQALARTHGGLFSQRFGVRPAAVSAPTRAILNVEASSPR